MVNIPYMGIQPVAASPQLPVMSVPRPYESLAQRTAASVLPTRPPPLPDPPNILTQFAQGAQLGNQLQQAFASPPPTSLDVAVMPQSVPMPSMTTPGGATIGGGMMQIPANSFSISQPAIPQMGLLGRIAQGLFS